MKKAYEKPEIDLIKFAMIEKIMFNDASLGVEGDDEEL